MASAPSYPSPVAKPDPASAIGHLNQNRLVVQQDLGIVAAAQQQGLLDPPLEMAIGVPHPPILMGHAPVVGALVQVTVFAPVERSTGVGT